MYAHSGRLVDEQAYPSPGKDAAGLPHALGVSLHREDARRCLYSRQQFPKPRQFTRERAPRALVACEQDDVWALRQQPLDRLALVRSEALELKVGDRPDLHGVRAFARGR